MLYSATRWRGGARRHADCHDDGRFGRGVTAPAVSSAAAGDTISFGSLSGAITLTSGEILINKNLTLAGPGASQLTINGNKAGRVLRILNANSVTVQGLTIAYGKLVGNNGGAGNGGGAGGGGGAMGAGLLIDSNSVVSIHDVTFATNVVQGGNGGGGGAGANNAGAGAGRQGPLDRGGRRRGRGGLLFRRSGWRRCRRGGWRRRAR